MKVCPTFSGNGPMGIAEALRSIDCLSENAVETAFARLFGTSSVLSQALTLILTIYIALLAISLLTGRTQLHLDRCMCSCFEIDERPFQPIPSG